MPTQRPIIDRFMDKVSPEPMTGCWLWNGFVNPNGYGKFEVGESRETSRMARAHRVSYEMFKGPIPEGMEIDHLCRVRSCVNPQHLEPVPPAENTKRGIAARSQGHAPWRSLSVQREPRVPDNFCRMGHEWTEANTIRRPYETQRRCRACLEITRKKKRQKRQGEAP